MPEDVRPDPELPRAVALAWGVAAHPQRGPKRELSIERIVEAAIAIADAEGLGAVSMSRVAASLGFTTMSLYRYVTGKDDLVLLMQEAAAAPPVPDTALERDWRTGVSAWLRSLRAVYREHPWLVDIPISGAPLTPNNLLIVDWFLRELRGLPLSDGEKMSALMLLTSYARASAAQERDIAAAVGAAEASDVTGASYFEVLAELVTPERFPDLSPLLAAGGYVPEPGTTYDDADDDFSFGLERILDGIEHHLDRLESAGEAGAAGAAGGGASDKEPALPPGLELPRDPHVREAAKARREAEKSVREAQKALREAQKRERAAITRALEREAQSRAKAERGR